MILVTGASGFVGRALCAGLVARGYAVRGAVRTAPRTSLPASDWAVVGEMGPDADWSESLVGVDTVVHLAARVHVMKELARDPLAEFRLVNGQGTVSLARAAAGKRVRRLVYVSSIKVNGERTEEQAFSGTDTPHPADPYAISKYEAEVALQQISGETGIEVVVVRPPLIYGPGVQGNFLRLLKWVERGIPLPLAAVSNRRSLLFIDNCVDALIACIRHPAAAGQVFTVSDGESLSTPRLLRELAVLMERPSRLWPFPPAALRVGARVAGLAKEMDRLVDSLEVDNTGICQTLGWSPVYGTSHGLAETVRWFKNMR